MTAQPELPPDILLRLVQLYQEREKPEEALSCCRRGLAALKEGGPALPAPAVGPGAGQRLE